MKNKIDLLHIYAGTRGASGLYLDEIYQALKNNYKQEVIVSAFYSFSYGKKWFYRYSDISSIGLNILKVNIIRKALRFFELIITLLRILIYVKVNKVNYINYGLTSDLTIELLFMRVLKLISNSKLIITCHDIIPFGSDDPNILSKKIEKKNKFFQLADYLLIHNENSKDELKKYYNIDSDKIFMIYFPLMDLNNLKLEDPKHNFIKDEKRFTVGMFGNLRKEKGVDVLLNAWSKMYSSSNKNQLIIAGYVPQDINYNFNDFKNKSVVIYDKFINDSDFKDLIESCDVVVLPYKRGTNSGIPSQITSLNTLVLTSDIPMFKNNSMVHRDFLFKSEDSIDLSSKIEWLSSLNSNTIEEYKKENSKLLVNYKESFLDSIVFEFNKINKIN